MSGKKLLVAVGAGDQVQIRKLVNAGVDINGLYDEGASVLFAASLSGDVELVQLLLDLGADPNLVAQEPSASIYAPKVLDLVMQAQFLIDWTTFTPILELLVRNGATDSDGEVPTPEIDTVRKHRSLEKQAGRDPEIDVAKRDFDRKPTSRFLGAPTRGGWLTIVNCLFWAVFFLWMHFGQPKFDHSIEVLVVVMAIPFSLPLAIFVILPTLDYSPTDSDAILEAIVIGVNSVFWGYGLSFLIEFIGKLAARWPAADKPGRQ